MTLRYADGFSIYGTGATGRANIVKGQPFTEINSTTDISTLNPHGNQTHCLIASSIAGIAAALRMAFGSNETVFGLGAFFYINQLPADNTAVYLFQARDSANAAQSSLVLSSTGTLILTNGTEAGTVLEESVAPVIAAGSWYHVEILWTIGNTGGAIVRVNGETDISITGVDTQATANMGAEQATFIFVDAPDGAILSMSDLQFWDTDGTVNNTFMGEVQWVRSNPDGDTAVASWTRNTGASDFAVIDDTTPDDDTTYLETLAVNNQTQFTTSNAPADASEVVGVVVRHFARKTGPGAAAVQGSIISTTTSPETSAAGSSHTLTESYQYYTDVHETDPATGVAFTPAGFNASRRALIKSA